MNALLMYCVTASLACEDVWVKCHQNIYHQPTEQQQEVWSAWPYSQLSPTHSSLSNLSNVCVMRYSSSMFLLHSEPLYKAYHLFWTCGPKYGNSNAPIRLKMIWFSAAAPVKSPYGRISAMLMREAEGSWLFLSSAAVRSLTGTFLSWLLWH